MFKITQCPSCGSERIKFVQCDWTGEFQGQSYVAPALEFYECSDCGEKLYDRQAMRKIEARSPAYAQTRAKHKKRPRVPLSMTSKTAKHSTRHVVATP